MKITLAIIALSVIQSVIVSHADNDIRDTILSSFQDKPKKELFKVYHFLFQKKYDLNTEEGLNRYRTFKSNMKFIESENAKNLGYTLGLTDFTDLTADEFRKTKLSNINPEELETHMEKFLYNEKPQAQAQEEFKIYAQDEDDMLIINSKSNNLFNLNENTFAATSLNQNTLKIDWTKKMNPVKNQGGCGSCWAFAVIHAIEGNYNIQFGNSPAFSEQQLVDCNKGSFGCDGGYPDIALNYITNKGIAFANDYPYKSGNTGKSDTCRESSLTMNRVVEGFETCRFKKCTREAQRLLLAKGPLVVYIDGDGNSAANIAFQHYKTGVLEMPCDGYNHAVVLTGVDADEKGEYLKGMNSWGSGWGEKGHFRIRTRDSDKTCFMEIYGSLPKVKETSNPEPPAPVPSCLKIHSECGLKGSVREICGNTPRIDNFPTMAGYDEGKFKNVRIYYEHPNCRGSLYIVSGSIDCFATSGFGKNLVNSVRSLIVDEQTPPTGCVWLFDDHCLAGNKVEVCGDVADLNDANFNFGNKTSSFILGPGIKGVTFYLGINYTGASSGPIRERYSLDGNWLNKDIESLKIIRRTKI